MTTNTEGSIPMPQTDSAGSVYIPATLQRVSYTDKGVCWVLLSAPDAGFQHRWFVAKGDYAEGILQVAQTAFLGGKDVSVQVANADSISIISLMAR